MRLIGKLTPKLSLHGTISKTAEVIGSNVQPLTVRNNGTYEASNGVDGFNPVYVNTPEPKKEQTKILNVDENGFYEVLPDSEKVLSSAKINVNVPPKEEQEKVVDITENGTTEVLPDENKVLSKVTVNANIPDTGELIETLIDNSGVLDSTEGSVEDKVEKLIDKAEELDVFMHITNANQLFYRAKSFPNKAVVNLPNATSLYQAFSYWNTEPIPIVEELIVNAPLLADSSTNLNGVIGQMFTFNCGVKKVVFNMSDGIQKMGNLFSKAKAVEEIVLNFSTKNVTLFSGAFNGSTVKQIIGAVDFSSATNVTNMFASCDNLEEVRFAPNTLSLSISLVNSSKLSADSVQSIIDGLATVTTAQTLTLRADVKARLTQTQLDTISGKNWNLA